MKTSSLLTSVLFGSLAAAAPLINKRAYVTHTSTVIQTEVVYTTVYASEAPKPTSSVAAFFEKPSGKPPGKPTSAGPVPTTYSAVPSASKPSVAPVQPPTVAPPPVKPTTPAPPPAPTTPSVPQPPVAKPTTPPPPPPPPATSAPAPPPAPTFAPVPAPAPAPAPAPPAGPSGSVHTGGSLTLNNFAGQLGSCGQPISDTEAVVALGSDLYGASTYDVATGNPTNKWCGQMVKITYQGKSTTAKIMDKCPGCTNGGFDATPAVWKALTGTDVGDRLYGMTWTTA